MNIKQILIDALKGTFLHLSYEFDDLSLAFSSREEADFQCNSAFSIAKKTHTSPEIVANAIASNLNIDDIAEVWVAKPGFVNFKIKDEAFSKMLCEAISDDRLGLSKVEEPIKIVMDYGGANVAKELHIGHLRSPVIGESLARLNKILGNEVVTDTHLGDWGLQMGLTIAGLEEEGFIDGYFDKKKQNKEITLDTLNDVYPKASLRKNTDEKFRVKAETYTKYVQDKKEPYWTIYNTIRDISVARIKANYENLNCYFDLWYGESTVADYVEPVVQMFVDKGLTRTHEGALVVDVAREGENIPIEKKNPSDPQLYKNPMPPVYLKKSNGADVYDTTDIATIYQRNKDFDPDKIVYVVDKRQYVHFEHCFRAVKKVGISKESQQLEFIGFGTVNGTDGKPFKTRSGDTIKLEDIIKLISSGAAKKLEENGIKDDDGKLALQIGVAAMKFGDLSNAPSKDYVFDIDKFASFEGKTGPYIQYTGARINSLLKKAGISEIENYLQNLNLIKIQDDNQRKIAMNFIKLQDSYFVALKENSLAGLCLALYDFASSFAKFYNDTRILSEKDDEKRNSYLSLSLLVLKAIKQAANVLAFDIPEKM